jgi:hypothetical protein
VLAAPDLIEPVIGYRQWRLREDRLRSPFRDETWEGAELHADCDHGHGADASHARIVGLALPPTHGRKRRRLLMAAAYPEVPAVPFRGLRALAAQHGHELPASLRPRRRLPWDL